MNNRDIIVTLVIMMILCLTFNSILFAEVYQWTDADGSEHFSDAPPNVSNNKNKKFKFKKTSELAPSPVQMKNEIKQDIYIQPTKLLKTRK